MKKQIADAQGNLRRFSKMIGINFLQQMKYFCLNRIKSDSVVMENIFSFCLHQLYQIAILPSIFHQAVQIVNRNPEYKPSIGHAFIVNDCMMLQTRRHYCHVSVLQRIFFFSISRDTSPSRKNKSHSNHGYGWQPFSYADLYNNKFRSLLKPYTALY